MRAGSGGDADGAGREVSPATPWVGLTQVDAARKAIAKVTRAEIRLKHSLLADDEIDRTLAGRLLDFDKQLQSGVVPSLALRLVTEQ